MDAFRRQLLGELFNQNKVSFRIPVYQRNYDWAESNCAQLLTDVKAIIDTGHKHFLGAMVYMETSGNKDILHDYVIIDGQQRITTTMILLKALYDVAKERGNGEVMDDTNDYLRNRNCKEEYKVKLKPIKSDQGQFLALLNDDPEEINPKGHIWLNYKVCRSRIQQWVNSGTKLGDILQGLIQLEVVAISLKEGEDDPQVIFQSINSTGVNLSTADLIRNFLLMSDRNQDRLFEKYWFPIETRLRRNTDDTNLNLFFSHYLTYKIHAPANDRRLYQSFVDLFHNGGYTHESSLKELKYFAEIYRYFVEPDTAGDKYSERIRKLLRGLRLLNQTTCYPFLLYAFHDYEQGVIKEDTLEKTVRFILAYVIRRGVCGVPTNSLRGMFSNLYNRVFKIRENKEKYTESIIKFLSTVSSRDQLPSDAEFRNALLNGSLYSNRSLCQYLIMDIENGDGKEVLKADNLTIEHIMPQTLTTEWSRIVTPEEHQRYLHTLGNLSVTGYNSELSNKSFSEKKRIIKENSKAVRLNEDVLTREVWNAAAIQERGERLAGIVLERYAVEKVNDPAIEFEYVSRITLAKPLPNVTGKKLVSFTFQGETYPQNKFVLMLVDMAKFLDESMPDKLETLAASNYRFYGKNQKRPHISYQTDKLRVPLEIRDGIFIEGNLSSSTVVHFLDRLMDEYHADKSSFYLSVAMEEQDISKDSMSDIDASEE